MSQPHSGTCSCKDCQELDSADISHITNQPRVYPHGTRGSAPNTDLGRAQRERDAARDALTAANARIAELERITIGAVKPLLDAANARTEAAERRADGLARSFEAAVDKLTRAESEAAALRASLNYWVAKESAANARADAAERWNITLQNARDTYASEAADLRAEVERLKDERDEAEEHKRQADESKLIERKLVWDAINKRWTKQLPRTEAEQRVLDAVRDIPDSEIRYGSRNWMGYAQKVAVAELARRGLT